VALFTLSFFALSAQPSPEQSIFESIQQLCHTCEILLAAVLTLGFCVTLALLATGARRGHS
jgi:hypothetical protein